MMGRKQFCVSLAAILFGCALTGAGQEKASSTAGTPVKAPGQLDQVFLKTAAVGNRAEIQLGQMAQQKAADGRVKQFAARMIGDHTNLQNQLEALAASQEVGLPTELDPPHQNAKSALQAVAGAQFDRDYMRLMVAEHSKTVGRFQREAANSRDPAVKKFAQDALPELESHLAEARQIDAAIQPPANP